MSRPRIIPILTISGNKLVKTVRFKNPKYIGDPLNAIKIFNDKMVDELIILDIEATKFKKEPNYKLIYEMAGEAFMPLGYGGGINNLEQAKKVFGVGIEKVVLNSTLLINKKIISEIAETYGSQSVVVSLDYKKNFLGIEKPYFFSGKKSLNQKIRDYAIELIKMGAGEIIIQNIEKEGTFKGLDINILETLSGLPIPIVIAGGCKDTENIKDAINKGAHAVAASSMFVYKNKDTNSILINYPRIHGFNYKERN